MRLISTLAAIALLLVSAAFPQTSGEKRRTVTEFKALDLLSEQVGWAATTTELFWTNDNGSSWKDIAPAEAKEGGIVDVFFVDPTHGWVLSVDPAAPNENAEFRLSITRDGGSSWTTNKLVLPPKQSWFTQIATLFFLDTEHGWANFSMSSGAQFLPGMLLQTSDGGRTWNQVSRTGIDYGEIRFTSLNDGWIAGGPGDHFLYHTQDGAKSWKRVSLSAPKRAEPATYPQYSLPVFKDGKHGYLNVTYRGPGISNLVVFRTSDGGKTWTPGKMIPKVGQPGMPATVAIVDSQLITATAYDQGGKVRVIKASAERDTPEQSFFARGVTDSIVWDMRFTSKGRGWMFTGEGLWMTDDGGASWKNISPELPADCCAHGHSVAPSGAGIVNGTPTHG